MQKQIPQLYLGSSDIKVSRIGLGCMGMSVFYNTNKVSDEENIELIGKALEQGVNFFDTATLYGDNEILLGKAIKKYGREKFVIATKVPSMIIGNDGTVQIANIPRTKENIKFYCNESLKRLGIDQIDLYYQHRIDQTIPIEDQAEAFKELIEEGKIKYYGLSEASVDTIRRAHKVCPVTAIQEEYSLFTRDIEYNGILETCRELGIAVVAYSPLGRGILTGNIQSQSDIDSSDYRKNAPRFQEENLKKNLEKIQFLSELASSLNATSSQIALAWLLAKGNDIFPIPGTKREKYFTQNNQSSFINLSDSQIESLDKFFSPDCVEGKRYAPHLLKLCTSDTPIKNQ